MNKKDIDKIIIYYFSGTGNAKSVALWIKQFAETNNVDTNIINIAKLEKRKGIIIPPNTLVGLCSPTHGFNFPPIVLNFIFRFPKSKGNSAFLINTRAGLKMGRYFVPGLSGIALLLSAMLLAIKGYNIIGLRSIDLPSNWISLHPGVKASVVESIFKKRKDDTIKFTQKILNGKRVTIALRDIVQDILIAPVAVMYYLMARFVFAKSFIASKKCTHCNLCLEECPVNAIKIVDNRCYWSYKCESCMKCMNICPKRAIETAHGFVIGITFLIYSVILVWIYRILHFEQLIGSFSSGLGYKIILMLFNSVIFLSLTFLFYRILHFLLKFRIFERLFVLTSLTNYKFWRRYKITKELRKLL
jgi:ferredoxin